ncbi:MAG TPA: hypothetical protein VGF38_24200 [Ktedonobacterales bacterium]|jgi:hypothetical protein
MTSWVVAVKYNPQEIFSSSPTIIGVERIKGPYDNGEEAILECGRLSANKRDALKQAELAGDEDAWKQARTWSYKVLTQSELEEFRRHGVNVT